MKVSAYVVLGLTATASAGALGRGIKKVVGGVAKTFLGRRDLMEYDAHDFYKRDIEYEEALLVIRDRTIGQWNRAVHDPSSISKEMLDALAAKGIFPPAQPNGAKAPSASLIHKRDPASAIPKALALQAVKQGEPIPPTTLAEMKGAGWTGPGLAKREHFDEDYLVARGYDEEYLDLYVRDVDVEEFLF